MVFQHLWPKPSHLFPKVSTRDVCIANYGNYGTLLQYAVYEGKQDFVRILLENGWVCKIWILCKHFLGWTQLLQPTTVQPRSSLQSQGATMKCLRSCWNTQRCPTSWGWLTWPSWWMLTMRRQRRCSRRCFLPCLYTWWEFLINLKFKTENFIQSMSNCQDTKWADHLQNIIMIEKEVIKIFVYREKKMALGLSLKLWKTPHLPLATQSRLPTPTLSVASTGER